MLLTPKSLVASRTHLHRTEINSELWFRLSLVITYSFAIVVHSLSHVWLFETPWTAAHQVSLSFTLSWSLLRLMSIESVMASNHLNLCLPLLLLPSISPSITVFSNESLLRIRWAKDWSFSSSISPSNEYSGLISFRMDWFDILDVQGLSRVFSSTTVQKQGTHLTIWIVIYVFVLLLGYHHLLFSTRATSCRPDFKREIHSSSQGSQIPWPGHWQWTHLPCPLPFLGH